MKYEGSSNFAGAIPFPKAIPQLAQYGLLASLFFLPLELVITQGAHGLLAPWIGLFFILVHPFTTLLVALVLLFPKPLVYLSDKPRNWWVVAMMGGIVLSTIVTGADPEATFRYLYFGCLSVIAGIVIARLSESTDLYLKAFFYGSLAWAAVVVGSYAYYAMTSPYIVGLSFSDAILVLRNPGPDVANSFAFFLLSGNVNKAANYAVLFMLLSAYLRLNRSIDLRLFLASQFAMAAILFVCFSRGGFLAAALLSLGFLTLWFYERVQFNTAQRRMLTASGLMLIPVLACVSTAEFREYWTDFSTVQRRLSLAEDVTDAPRIYAPEKGGALDARLGADTTVNSPISKSDPSLLLGYGIGFYGLEHFRSPMAGTHNYFIDVWTIGGLLAFVANIFFIGWSIVVAARQMFREPTIPRSIGLAGLCTIVVLGFREYDLAYLWATSLGGLFLGLFAGLCQDGKMIVPSHFDGLLRNGEG